MNEVQLTSFHKFISGSRLVFHIHVSDQKEMLKVPITKLKASVRSAHACVTSTKGHHYLSTLLTSLAINNALIRQVILRASSI